MARQSFKVALDIEYTSDYLTQKEIINQLCNSLHSHYGLEASVEDYAYTEPELIEQKPEDNTHNV